MIIQIIPDFKRKHVKNVRYFLALISVFFIIILITSKFATTKLDSKEPLKIIKISVAEGDSLWKIAERYDNNKMDIRKYIYKIQDYKKL